jgi:MFS family permease
MRSSRRGRSAVDGVQGTFYGWYVVAALFFALFLGMGALQGFGVFVETWEEEFNVSVATISIAAAIGVLVNGLSGPLMGRLIDRIGGRRIVMPSLAIVGAGCIAVGLVGSFIGVLVFYGIVIALAVGGVSPVVSGAVVSRWFQRRRGTAISVFASGGSFGGLLLIPFLTYMRIATDWETAWMVMGVIILALGLPLVWLVVRDDPRDVGLQPDGGRAPLEGEVALAVNVPPLEAVGWRDSFRTAPMWQLVLTFVVCGVTTQAVAVHFIRWASDEGVSAGTAALAFGLLSGINAMGVLVIGYVSDRMQRRSLLSLVYLVRALAFVALITLPGGTAIWVFAVVGGVSWLATVPLTQALTADVYGLRHLGMLTGLIFMAHQLGGALAVYLFGVAFDAWGSYDWPYAVSAALLVAAAFGAFSIREKRYSVRYAGAPMGAASSGE